MAQEKEMNVGDLVKWHCTSSRYPLVGIITKAIHSTMYRVRWTDGTVSAMFVEELERIYAQDR